jgi:hypothetical protein
LFRREGLVLVKAVSHACIALMRFATRPMFYLILLLALAAMVLTGYVMWKLPEAEELSRAKKKSAQPSLPANQP